MAGLDEILGGGLPRSEMYLVRGGAGTGRTTLGLQFLRTRGRTRPSRRSSTRPVVELGETMSALMTEIERTEPDRVVVDAIAQIQHLADAPLRYHRELLSLRNFLSMRRATDLLTDSGLGPDQALAPIGRDADLGSARLLAAGIDCRAGRVLADLDRTPLKELGAVVLIEEALTGAVVDALVDRLAAQAPWSNR